MPKISYKEFLDFLASDLDEAAYFDCDKSSLISLKEYLNGMKQKKEQYDELVSEPLKSIQNKNRWVIDIKPSHYLDENGLLVLGKTQPTFLLGIDSNFSKGNPDDYIRIGGYYVTPFLNLKMKTRSKILENSQEELHEINKIAHQLNILGKTFNTVSGKFSIDSSNYGYCDIECLHTPIIRIIISTGELKRIKPYIDRETIYKKDGFYPKPLTLDERKKLVKKLYIKQS